MLQVSMHINAINMMLAPGTMNILRILYVGIRFYGGYLKQQFHQIIQSNMKCK